MLVLCLPQQALKEYQKRKLTKSVLVGPASA